MNRIILKNISSTYLCRIWIGIISLISVPYLINKLGVDAYGVLSLSLIVIGYSSLFDFGLARGITKYIAEYNVINDIEKIRKLVKTSFSLYLIMGLVGALILAILTHFFLMKIFKIPGWMQQEALITFYLTAFYLIFRLPQLFVQAIAIGYQKIYLLNFINTIFNSLKIIFSVVVLWLGYFLQTVVVVNVIIGIVHFFVLYIFVKKSLPQGSVIPSYDKNTAAMVLGYSIKSFTADSIGMFITYVDKFIIGIFLPIANLAYYSVPFEISSRAWEFQVSAIATLFPTFSMYNAANENVEFDRLYRRITKAIVITAVFVSTFVSIFAIEILKYWIGLEFALRAHQILRVVSWGVLTSSLLSIIGIILYSTSNLSKAIKVNLVMLTIHIIVSLVLIHYYGIFGIALSWLLTHLIGLFILVPWVNKNLTHFPVKEYIYNLAKPIIVAFLIVLASYHVFRGHIHSLIFLITIGISDVLLYSIASYFILLSKQERYFFKGYALSFIEKMLSRKTL